MIFEFAKQISTAEYQQFEAHETDFIGSVLYVRDGVLLNWFQLSRDLTSRMRFLDGTESGNTN